MILRPNRLFTSAGILLFILSLPLNNTAQCSERQVRSPAIENKTFFDHSGWDAILKRFVVVDGPISQFRYSDLKHNPDGFFAYIKSIKAVTRADFSKFPESEKLAFLINAYNALTVKLIIDHYPIKSIKDIGGVFSSPWKKKFFTLFGEIHHLDDIEHGMIRKNFHEPRIHFALVCASRGCPALRAEAYVAGRLDSQLDDAARTFINDHGRNRFDPSHSKLFLSSLFKWYSEDFKTAAEFVQAFVARYMNLSQQGKQKLVDSTIRVVFLGYDWSLNDVRPVSGKQVGQMNTEIDTTDLTRKKTQPSSDEISHQPGYIAHQRTSNYYTGRPHSQQRNPAQAPADVPTSTTNTPSQGAPELVSPVGSSTENVLSTHSHIPVSDLPNRQIASSASELLDAIQSSGLAPGSNLGDRWIFQQNSTKYIPSSRGEYGSTDLGSTTVYGSGTQLGSTTEGSSGLAY